MRRYSLVAAATLLTASLAANADTITTNLSVAPNTVATQDQSSLYGADTNFFAQFNPALGTLNSITLSLAGSATSTSQDLDLLVFILPALSTQEGLGFSPDGFGFGGSTFAFSGSGQDTIGSDFPFFEGAGTQALRFDFNSPTTVNSAGGTLTYNYTAAVVVPPVAVTPEPSSLALLGSGILGVAGVLRKRFA